MGKVGNRRRPQFNAKLPCLRHQRVDEMPVLDHVREGLALLHLAAEGQKSRTHRVIEFRVGDHHVEDRLRRTLDRVPDLDRLEQPTRRGRDRRCAQVIGFRHAQSRVGHRDHEAFTEPLAQRDRKCQPGKACAADENIGFMLRFYHRGSL